MAGQIREERRLAIARTIRSQPLVRADDLARQFGVSVEAVRRDLKALERAGLLQRVYGGAKGVSPRSFEPSIAERRRRHHTVKRAMGGLAVELLRPGDTVIFDVGTSVAEVARQLPWSHHGRVLTNFLPVAFELDGRDGVEVLVRGGRLRVGDLALSGARRPDAQRSPGRVLGTRGPPPARQLTATAGPPDRTDTAASDVGDTV